MMAQEFEEPRTNPLFRKRVPPHDFQTLWVANFKLISVLGPGKWPGGGGRRPCMQKDGEQFESRHAKGSPKPATKHS